MMSGSDAPLLHRRESSSFHLQHFLEFVLSLHVQVCLFVWQGAIVKGLLDTFVRAFLSGILAIRLSKCNLHLGTQWKTPPEGLGHAKLCCTTVVLSSKAR
jgi:hypothetical protein